MVYAGAYTVTSGLGKELVRVRGRTMVDERGDGGRGEEEDM
jgi:hypothetical protein